LDFLDDCSPNLSAFALRLMIKALCAAWPLQPQVSPIELARGFGCDASAEKGNRYRELLRGGNAWLRSVLQSSEN
jgi:hypothetical protein